MTPMTMDAVTLAVLRGALEQIADEMGFTNDVDRRSFVFMSLAAAAATTFGFGAKAVAQGGGAGRGAQQAATPPVPLDNMEEPSWTFQPYPGGTGALLEKTYRERGPAAFNRQIKVLFLGIGSEEGPGTKAFSDALTKAGVHNVYFESPGTAHEWLTWRRCLNDFAPRLFR